MTRARMRDLYPRLLPAWARSHPSPPPATARATLLLAGPWYGDAPALPMNLLDRISIDPSIRFGKPCVRGTRLTVGEILAYLATGASEQDLIADFPQLVHEDVLACLAFAAERERRIRVEPAA